MYWFAPKKILFYVLFKKFIADVSCSLSCLIKSKNFKILVPNGKFYAILWKGLIKDSLFWIDTLGGTIS